MKVRSKKWLVGFAVLVAIVVVLIWPIGTWLQYEDVWLEEGNDVEGVVYLVAGARDQNRRIDAVIERLVSVPEPAASANNNGTMVLIGNDISNHVWSNEAQMEVTRTERAVERLGKICDDRAIEIMVVPGLHNGTDAEMRILAEYLTARSVVQDVILVTSPFHVRRVVWRFRKHADSDVTVSAIVAGAKWTDRAPWVVIGEMAKMARDCLGLSGVRFLSRG